MERKVESLERDVYRLAGATFSWLSHTFGGGGPTPAVTDPENPANRRTHRDAGGPEH